MMPFVSVNFLEEFAAFIESEANLDYVVGENLSVGDFADPIQDFPHLLAAQRNSLAIYDAGGTLTRTSHRTHADRSVRFITRGQYAQDAINNAFRLHGWVENELRHFTLPSFTARHLSTQVQPVLIVKGEDGSALANFVVTFRVINLVIA